MRARRQIKKHLFYELPDNTCRITYPDGHVSVESLEKANALYKQLAAEKEAERQHLTNPKIKPTMLTVGNITLMNVIREDGLIKYISPDYVYVNINGRRRNFSNMLKDLGDKGYLFLTILVWRIRHKLIINAQDIHNLCTECMQTSKEELENQVKDIVNEGRCNGGKYLSQWFRELQYNRRLAQAKAIIDESSKEKDHGGLFI